MIHLLCTFVLKVNLQISWDGTSEKVTKGETVLVPAMIKEITLTPVNKAKVIEVFINSENTI